MASTNQSPFYQRAEQEFQEAINDEERMTYLKIMMKECPKHKSSENMRKNLTNRYKKLKANIAKQKKSGRGKQAGIKKADMQCVLTGFPNTGKSTIFKTLTKLNSKISPHPFTTYQPQLGTFYFEDAPVQLIDTPAFPNHDKSLINSTDTILLVIDKIEQIRKSEKYIFFEQGEKNMRGFRKNSDLCHAQAKIQCAPANSENKSARVQCAPANSENKSARVILIYNKEDLLTEGERRKIEATLKSKYKKLDYIFFSEQPSQTQLNELTKKIFETFPIIRIYTKEPKKDASKEPMILKKNSTFKEATEKILKGMSGKIKRARIWGPSSKFGGQIIGLGHILKDKDTIEFQTK